MAIWSLAFLPIALLANCSLSKPQRKWADRPDWCHVKVAWDRSATGDLLLARVQQTATSGERENVTDVRHPSVDSVDSVDTIDRVDGVDGVDGAGFMTAPVSGPPAPGNIVTFRHHLD